MTLCGAPVRRQSLRVAGTDVETKGMDTITQAALGAAVGAAGFGHSLGKRALWFGAFCGLVPDFDVVARVLGPWESLKYHRAESHSLLVLPFIALLLGYWSAKVWNKDGKWLQWSHLAFWGLVTHPLLDLFTSYGTQLFTPLSHQRFALDGVAIIDPIYTIPLLFIVIRCLRMPESIPNYQMQAWGALMFGTIYLFFGIYVSHSIQKRAQAQLQTQQVEIVALRTPPVIFFPFLRRIAAKDSLGNIYVGNASFLANQEIGFEKIVPPEENYAERLKADENGALFYWFAQELVSLEPSHQKGQLQVRLLDQRYGMILQAKESPFSALAHFDETGKLLRVERLPRPRDIDLPAELAAGWQLMWTGKLPLSE